MADQRVAILATLILTFGACRENGARAVPIETGTACAFCRMAIADAHLAAEVVAPGEEPRQYDDIGCLAADLQKRGAPDRARAFVADYRSGTLVPAGDAVYSRADSIATPMGSHLVAHADAAARDADARVRGDARLTAREVFGADGLPGGSHAR